MKHLPKDEITREALNLQAKANDKMLDWWFEPELILDLTYWKDSEYRKTSELESAVKRLFRFVSKKLGIHIYFTLHVGRADSSPHAHVQARMSFPNQYIGTDFEGIMNPELVELRDMLRESWLHIIGTEPEPESSETTFKRPKHVPALVRTADDYIEDYRGKNETPPPLSEKHRLQQRRQILGARVANYVHNGHFWSGSQRFHVACPKPRHGRCAHHQDVSMGGEV